MSFTEILTILFSAMVIGPVFLVGWVMGFFHNWALKLMKKKNSDFEGI